LAKYHSPKDYLEDAKSPETSPAELRELAKASYSFFLTAVANNPNTESDVLIGLIPEKIESSNEQLLATAIVHNPNTSADALEILAERLVPVLDNGRDHRFGFEAGISLCINSLTPIRAISAMLYSEQVAMQFCKVVARETRRRDVLEILLADRSEKVRKQAQKSIQALDTGAEN
jgi:hypothetical protein